MLKIDLSGQVFGKWTVLYRDASDQKYWFCKCACGIEVKVYGGSLTGSKSLQCDQCNVQNHTHNVRSTHNMRNSSEYNSWRGMKKRCYDSNHENYPIYGGRGITVCDRWRNSFKNFIDDMGVKPSKRYSLDRIDPNGNYEPGNVRWATMKDQNRNKKFNRYVTYEGQQMLLIDLTEKLNIDYEFIKSRLDRGWSLDESLSTPKLKPGRYKKLA